jgi:pimeloyl-ACP methyl ester carboxylesterase
MAIYVLVHGAGSGGWSWRHFAPLLRARGHEVFAPSLTGLGERAHLSGPQVTLSTHIQDVVNIFEFEELEDVILVGHSYGGMVITGVVEQIGERVAHLVYEDAFLPKDGQSCGDLGGRGRADRSRLVSKLMRSGAGRCPSARLRRRFVCEPNLRSTLFPARNNNAAGAVDCRLHTANLPSRCHIGNQMPSQTPKPFCICWAAR